MVRGQRFHFLFRVGLKRQSNRRPDGRLLAAALVAEECWERRQDLIFGLGLHRAECEFLAGQVTSADEHLIALSSHASEHPTELPSRACRADIHVALRRLDRSAFDLANSPGGRAK
jgi:hypothetical protein